MTPQLLAVFLSFAPASAAQTGPEAPVPPAALAAVAKVAALAELPPDLAGAAMDGARTSGELAVPAGAAVSDLAGPKDLPIAEAGLEGKPEVEVPRPRGLRRPRAQWTPLVNGSLLFGGLGILAVRSLVGGVIAGASLGAAVGYAAGETQAERGWGSLLGVVVGGGVMASLSPAVSAALGWGLLGIAALSLGLALFGRS